MSEALGTIIATHAIHGLVTDGTEPGPIFAAHIRTSAAIFKDPPSGIYHELGILADDQTNAVYVPGSRHRGDERSLSDAGADCLIDSHEIPESSVHGEDWSDEYGPNQGIYHSGAEALVVSGACRALHFSRVVAVCSPGQIRRLRLHYSSYGIRPAFVTVSAGQESHQGTVETLLTAYTQYLNPSWKGGWLPAIIRSTRIPNDGYGMRSLEFKGED